MNGQTYNCINYFLPTAFISHQQDHGRSISVCRCLMPTCLLPTYLLAYARASSLITHLGVIDLADFERYLPGSLGV